MTLLDAVAEAVPRPPTGCGIRLPERAWLAATAKIGEPTKSAVWRANAPGVIVGAVVGPCEFVTGENGALV